MQWKMDSNSSSGGFGENFLEDFMNTSSELNESTPSVVSQGVDILQQSLKAADILDNSTEDISFDDFGFSLDTDSYNHNVTSSNYPFQIENHSASAELYMPQLSETSLDTCENLFDTEQFLNVSSTVGTSQNLNHSIQNNTYIKPAASVATHQQYTTASQENSSLVLPSVIQPRSAAGGSSQQVQYISSHVTQPVQSLPFQVSLATKPSTLFTKQTDSNSMPNVLQSFQTSQYVASGIQTVPQYSSSSYTVCTGTALQSNTVAVCNSGFTNPIINQSHSTPVFVNVSPAVASVSVNSSTHLNHAAIVAQQPQRTPISNHEEQVNKLTLLLQNKAAQQAGSSNNPGILRVGNQNINISDPAVAKALATKILEQKMKQYSQNQPQHTTSTQQIANTAQDCVVSIPTLPSKSVVVSNPQHMQPQVKTQYVISSIPQTSNGSGQNSFIQLGRPSKVLPLHSTVNTVIQPKNALASLSVTKSGSSVPINRIQIASVNIPLTSNQMNVINATSAKNNVSMQGINITPNDKKTVISVQTGSRSMTPVQTLPMTIVTSASNALMQQLGTNLKLNLTNQQTSSLSRDQLQKLLMQHQAAVRARRVKVPITTTQVKVSVPRSVTVASVMQPKIVPSSVPSESVPVKPPVSKLVSCRVDPNLTWQQVQQVQQFISQKLPFNKVSPLTKEQKQLLAAFRAHLRSMDPPIQQYYLRNPQFFLQKVYQHLQTGKPFIFHAKLDVTNSSGSVLSVTTTNTKSQHPTISLSTDSQRNSQQTVKLNHALPVTSLPVLQRRGVKRTAANSFADVTAQAIAFKRPSLIMEQLKKHQDVVVSPDTEKPFQTVRDACRRLLPYHVYNMPQIKEEHFTKSEPVFDDVSQNLVTKMETMLNKYHLLCLKDAAREVCAADVVMLERCFLQHERAMFVELKGKLKDDPSAIVSYLSPQCVENNPDVVSYLNEQLAVKEGFSNHRMSSHLQNASYDSSNSLVNGTDLISDACRGNISQGCEPVECEVVPIEQENEILLQEAVESILS